MSASDSDALIAAMIRLATAENRVAELEAVLKAREEELASTRAGLRAYGVIVGEGAGSIRFNQPARLPRVDQ